MTACAKEKVWDRSIYSSGSLDSVKVSLRRETWPLMTENQLVGCQPLMLVHFNILQLINMCFYYIFEYCCLTSLSVSFGRLVFCSDCIFRNQWLTFLRRIFYLRKIIYGIKKKKHCVLCAVETNGGCDFAKYDVFLDQHSVPVIKQSHILLVLGLGLEA